MPDSSQISVVLDPDFGSQLPEQVECGPLWIIDTPANRDAIENYWAEHLGQNHLEGVTIFTASCANSSEDAFIGDATASPAPETVP